MKTIWKFPFPLNDRVGVEMPAGAEIIAVGAQGSQCCLWAIVDPAASSETRHLAVIGTGHPYPDVPLRHLGTTQMLEGALVWHVFEVVG